MASACFSSPPEVITIAPTEDSSSGDVMDDESSGSSGSVEEWTGDSALLLRSVVGGSERTCDDACGASTCVSGYSPLDDLDLTCAQVSGSVECECADAVDVEDASHVASRCYLDPNSSSREAADPPMWASGSCEDYCGAFGFECAGTVWGSMKRCPDLSQTDWPLFEDGPTTRPEDVAGPDGVFVVLCAL